ncbi:cytochrome P450 6A1 [Lophiostoma macrostomum CBS 122681]|uniref:Cytochrome P450 6A1 n=1 Tax=Lophiostoma macrostomum CBS 122681 TaxID=1314788 RepID=A0A6A6TNR2_9PLEO|nr:cytochrome P450 6A1 [Lophiostoma macrostomum CBS 122681]
MAFSDIFETVIPSPSIFLLVLAVLFTVYVVITTYNRRIPAKAPPAVSGDFPLTGAIQFWTRRWDWFQQMRGHSPSGNFSFHAGPNTLVALSGERGRRIFYENKDLNFNEGYAVLFGSSPQAKEHVKDEKPKDLEEHDNHFSRRLTYLLRNENFRKKLPTLLSDVQDGIEAIRNDPSGRTNPFESIYRIVFKLTIRMVAAEEIAEDPKHFEACLKYFEMIDESATAAAVMFPKVPSPAIIKRTYAGARLFMMMENFVKKRAQSDEKRDDALQYMLDQGDRMFKILTFVVGALFAGLLNSGINAAWVLCYLATSPEWLAKAQEEVRTTAAKYARDPNAPLRHQLADIPLEAWESEFPVVDLCLKDSIRLNLLGTAFRKNTGGREIPIGNGEVIPPNAFVTYATGDIHLNPESYPNPEKWDPARYLPERAEDKKAVHGFVGWGVARHPCLGMRFAKLEQNIITAYFLASFDFQLEDKNGNKLIEAPKVNLNGHSAHKPKVPQILRVFPKDK